MSQFVRPKTFLAEKTVHFNFNCFINANKSLNFCVRVKVPGGQSRHSTPHSHSKARTLLPHSENVDKSQRIAELPLQRAAAACLKPFHKKEEKQQKINKYIYIYMYIYINKIFTRNFCVKKEDDVDEAVAEATAQKTNSNNNEQRAI